jgi:hypothetical protein
MTEEIFPTMDIGLDALLLCAAGFAFVALLCYGCAKGLWERGGIRRLLVVLCFVLITGLEVLPFFVSSTRSPEYPLFIVAWGLGMHLLLVISVADWVLRLLWDLLYALFRRE